MVSRASDDPANPGWTPTNRPQRIVAIGVAAESLEILPALVRALAGELLEAAVPPAILIVQHSGAQVQDRLFEVLEHKGGAPLPIQRMRDGMALLPGRVYAAPLGSVCTVEEGDLRVIPTARREERRVVIDRLLCSLAEQRQAAVVAVVLAGTGTDGALGLKAISDSGGMTIVQDPAAGRLEEAEPSATLGAADHVLPPEQIGEVVLAYLHHLSHLGRAEPQGHLGERIAATLPALCEMLYKATDHDFKMYKTSTLVRRVLRRMQVRQVEAPESYLELCRADNREAEALFKELLISVTDFFRDPEAFEALSEEVLARLLAPRGADDVLRVWVPGCATGEEAYSLAILLRERLAGVPGAPEVQIFATDINERSLQVARHGIYPQGIAEHVSPERLQRFFVKKDRHYHVIKELRERCLFSLHNLISDPPFSRIDLISCRNLLIYLGSPLQKKLIPLFHYALRPGGYLFLGPAESVTSHEELFRVVNARHRIAQRKATAISQVLPVLRPGGARPGAAPLDAGQPAELDLPSIAQRIILDEFAPRHVVVNEEGKILCCSTGTSKYLEPASGTFQNHVLKMTKRGLRVGLRAALAEAQRTRRTVSHGPLFVDTERGALPVSLTVQPMPHLGQDQPIYMVVFQDAGPPQPRDEARARVAPEQLSGVIEQLEYELQTTRVDLEKTIHELESSNEDLKSSNEELLSMNEELQSTNEELETAKEEVQAANEALALANADLENLFTSTQVATLFLDSQGHVQRFTPAVARIYNLRPSDIGRPLGHITHRALHMPPLPPLEDLGQQSGCFALDDALQTQEGLHFLRRILPYRSDGATTGLVVTFTDVTALKETERALREGEARLRLALEFGGMGTWDWNLITQEVVWDAHMFALCGLSPETCVPAVGTFLAHVHPEDQERVSADIQRSLDSGGEFSSEFRFIRPSGAQIWLAGRGRVLRATAGQPLRMVGLNYDITDSKQAEAELQQVASTREVLLQELSRTVQLSDLFIGILGHDLRNPLAAIALSAGRLKRGPLDAGLAQRVTERVLSSAGRMERMITQILDLTRIRLGRGLPLEPQPVDLGVIVRSVADELTERDSADGGFAIEPDGDLSGQWDGDRLEQLTSNLMGNALQHRAEAQPVRLSIDGRGAEAVVMKVWNAGAIPEPLRATLFEPLQGGRRSSGAGGLGLGLYISRHIALAHGGSLEVSSDSLQGTTFTLRLPRRHRGVVRTEAQGDS